MAETEPMVPYFVYGFVILLAVIIAGRTLTPFLVLLRTRFRQYVFTRLENAPLTPLHTKLLDELAALGFHARIDYSLEVYTDRYTGFVLTHDSLPIVATVICYPWQSMGYPISFESKTTDGILLSTGNMQPGLLPFPNTEWLDAKASTLSAHFAAHHQRTEGRQLATESLEEAYAARAKFNADYIAYQLAEGNYICTKDGDLYYSARTAWKITRQLMRLRKVIKRGYAGFSTDPDYQSRFFAECYQFQESAYKQRKGRRRVNATMLLITIAISLTVWGTLFGWYFALALLAILAVHEYGHGIVMYLFGYRDMSMFLSP